MLRQTRGMQGEMYVYQFVFRVLQAGIPIAPPQGFGEVPARLALCPSSVTGEHRIGRSEKNALIVSFCQMSFYLFIYFFLKDFKF